jgi:hypothetical protein
LITQTYFNIIPIYMQGQIYREVIEAETSGPLSCTGPFQGRWKDTK